MSRLRIERRRLAPPGPDGRIRRDPRAERLGIAPPQAAAAEAAGPSGRIRRDPRAARGPGRAAPAAEPAQPALPRRAAVENPACIILAIPDLEDGRLDSHDRDLLGAARLLADAGSGNVVALVPEGASADFAASGADFLLPAMLPSG